MEWTNDAIVLSARKHGETSLIIHLLTETYGRHAGLVKGGASKRNRGIFQQGNIVRANWRARLPDHLGNYSCELTKAVAADLLSNRMRLSGLSAACAVVDAAIPEREAHEPIYQGLRILIDSFTNDELWPSIYVRWELGLLQELGFGLDFSACASTGQTDDLVYVSPKSGKAVSSEAGAPYKDVLLELPPFLLTGNQPDSLRDVHKALKLTGYFLERHVFRLPNSHTPPARGRLLERLQKTGA